MTEREEFVEFLEHMEAGFRKQSPTITREEMLLATAFALFQENRCTTPDREPWISVDERLPACNRKASSQGIEVLIWPAMESGEKTAFFGKRISMKPMFYRYGAPVHGVTHWMALPDAPGDIDRAGGA